MSHSPLITFAASGAATAPRALWSHADLEAALHECARQAWLDEQVLLVMGTLEPMLAAQGFSCGAPEALEVGTFPQPGKVTMQATRSLVVHDPLGGVEGVRLQASVGCAIVVKAHPDEHQSTPGHRQAGLHAALVVELSYATPDGALLRNAPALAGTALVATQGTIDTATPQLITAWWQAKCGAGCFSASGDDSREPNDLGEMLEEVVVTCVNALAP